MTKTNSQVKIRVRHVRAQMRFSKKTKLFKKDKMKKYPGARRATTRR